MLQTLRIQNYALIDEIEVEFSDSLNVLTGETGAGKSIIVGALNLVLGARASADTVRNGAKTAQVDAIFHISTPSSRLQALLEEHSIDLEENDLLLSRSVSAAGRSKAYANGRLIPVSVQAALGDELVDLHGQHEHQSLLRTDRQVDLLDSYAGLNEQVAVLADAVRELRDLENAVAEFESTERDETRQMDFLRFEAEEIKKANLQPGEEEEIISRRNLITNAEQIYTLTSEARTLLSDAEDRKSALDALSGATDNVEQLAQIDERFEPLSKTLREILNDVENVAQELLQYTDQVEYDPKELDALNERLSAIRSLQRKFGDTIEDIIVYHKEILDKIDAYENRDRHLEKLQEKRAAAEIHATELADKLTKKRKRAAQKLDARVTDSLQDLGMDGAAFSTRIEPGPLTSTGGDRIDFLLSANTGESLKPLKHVASGGEISRIMLALKGVFAESDQIPTLIFDEIDSGIGGAVATKVAARLRELAASHQTICITHLPQIAAAGICHFHVSKATQDAQTLTEVNRVDDASRVEELARLLDGSVTEISLNHARTLLEELAS